MKPCHPHHHQLWPVTVAALGLAMCLPVVRAQSAPASSSELALDTVGTWSVLDTRLSLEPVDLGRALLAPAGPGAVAEPRAAAESRAPAWQLVPETVLLDAASSDAVEVAPAE